MRNDKKGLWIMLVIVAIVGIAIVVYMTVFNNSSQTLKTYSDLQQYIIEDKVVSIDVENDKATFKLENGDVYYCYVPERGALDEFILGIGSDHQIKVSYNNRYTVNVWDYITPVFMVVAMIVIGLVLFRSINNGNRQVADFSKSGAE